MSPDAECDLLSVDSEAGVLLHFSWVNGSWYGLLIAGLLGFLRKANGWRVNTGIVLGIESSEGCGRVLYVLPRRVRASPKVKAKTQSYHPSGTSVRL